MEDDAKTKAKRPRALAKAPLTVEAAQELILQKLAKAGAKGTVAPHPKPKASSQDGAIYERALAILEDERRQEVFINRRSPKPKYYLWTYRPRVPSAEDVARKLLSFAKGAHPQIHHEAGFTKNAGLEKDERKLVPAALLLLCDGGKFAALEFAPTTKTRHTLYVVTEALKPGGAEPDEAAPAPVEKPTSQRVLSLDELKPAYDQLVRQAGFPAVPIASLQKAAGVPMEALKELLRRERDAGGVALSVGDWSIASEQERQGVIDMHGRQYLQVRWLT